jgi:hypothetical protein
MRYLVALLLFVGVVASAQTPRTATITFTRPTAYTDGTPVATSTALSYKVFQGAKGSTSKALVGTITATNTTISSGLQPGETCWQIVVVANGVDSAASGEACKTFSFPPTEAVTITVI